MMDVRIDRKVRVTKTILYLQLSTQLDHIEKIIRILRTEELRKYNITYAQLSILLRVWSCNNNITPAELGRDLLRKPNTISLILKRMVRDGLIKKTPSPRKKNVKLLSITAEGEKILHLDRKITPLKKIFSQLSEEQLKSLTECIIALDRITNKELRSLQKKSDYINDLDEVD